LLATGAVLGDERPNVLWIVVEDASPHVGCYGETTIETPHIDALAAEGVRFTRAFVTAPVCSPSRSAMVTGMYQTTLGAHNHRSQRAGGKGGGNAAYDESFRLPVPSVPELFRRAGYYVTNSGLNKTGKTDYNFTGDLYDPGDWADRKPGQPFFAQVQLHGGKARGAKVDDPVDPAAVTLPPYYPDDPVLRRDWAAYLNSWIKTDREVGQIIRRLRDEGVLDSTAVFFWTDHGVSHVRGKQFLYDEGIRVPLIVRFGDGRAAGSSREDLVEHIDVAATSLALAGIAIPDFVQGRDLFAGDYKPRSFVFATRDRCDETVDVIRAVRTKRYKYIRNFLSHLPHAQPNQYKDGKAITQAMRRLHREGGLSELQARVFEAPRPAEELYDVEADPHETVNLAEDPKFRGVRDELRRTLYDHMVETRDVGLIPEPILEDLGREHGSKYHVLRQSEHAGLVRSLIDVIDAGQRGDRQALLKALQSERPSVRYHAATWLGILGDRSAAEALAERADDEVAAVRVAVSLALCQLGRHERHAPRLARLIEDENLIVGMYAIRALEHIGPQAAAVQPAIEAARESRYEFTRRIANRLTDTAGD
jgi:arylsulfatase A-like enzyme